MSAPLTAHALREMLAYDPETGRFTWRVRQNARPQWNARYSGTRAGYEWVATGGKRYRSIRIGVRPYAEHRLAHLYMTGVMPIEVVDHVDGNGTNNRWSNLRAASRSQNAANAGAWKNNKIGLRGVSRCKKSGLFRAAIYLSGRQTYIGRYRTPEEAHAAYLRRLSEKSGAFARRRPC